MSQQILTNQPLEKPYLTGLSTNKTLFKITKPQFYQNALKTIETSDFPSPKEEYWKYSKLDKIYKQSFDNQVNKSNVTLQISPLFECAAYLVFVNGFYKNELSYINQSDILVKPISELFGTELDLLIQKAGSINQVSHFFSAVNTVYSTDGAYIHITQQTIVEQPIYIKFISDTQHSSSILRNLIHLESGAKAEIILDFESSSQTIEYSENLVNEIFIEKNAQLNWINLQNQNQNTTHIQTTDVELKQDSRFTSHYISLGGSMIRNNVNVALEGSNIESHLYGVTKIQNQQMVDHHTYIAHNKPHCESKEMYKQIVQDKAQSVFNGKIYVKKDAQKTNAFQSSQNILVGDTAKAYSKPELEIYADDVKCSHGSTTGQLNEEAKFYLKTRGIGEENANILLIQAFVGQVIDTMKNNDIKKHVYSLIFPSHS